jgi:mycothiol synthase
MSTLHVPMGYSIRSPSVEDATAIAEFVNEVNVDEVGFPWTSTEEVRDNLTSPDRESEDDVLLVADDGALAGYLTLWAAAEPLSRIYQLAFVRPALWGRGLSAWLLRLGEERARGKMDRSRSTAPVSLTASRWAVNEGAGRLFAALGYRYARTFHDMRVELEDPIWAPQVPDGIVIRPFDRERDARAVYGALAEAFAEHWGFRFDSFDRFVHEHIEGESSGFDARLWFLALDGDEVVGAICSREGMPSSPDAASIDVLGVRRAWRGRGTGRALLLSAFAELHRRAIRAVELVVDSGNETGATRLYEQVGMRTVRHFEHWEKVLRKCPPRPGE